MNNAHQQRKTAVILTAIYVSLFCALSCAPADAGNKQSVKKKKIVVIAHRGVHHNAPENSLAAIQAAIDIGCDYVEVDVRTTKDGHLVLMHDSTVNRTTLGTGKVVEMTLAEIRGLRFKKKEYNQKVPTFDEALKFCKKRIKVYVDHKDAEPGQVVDALKKHKLLDQVVVYSSLATLRKYKKLYPKIWITTPHPQTVAGIRQLAIDLKPETLDGHVRSWTREQVIAAHEAKAEIWIDHSSEWDTPEGVKKSLALGVDAIQSDNARKLILLLKQVGRR